MRDQMTIERLDELRGSPIYDSDGQKIGKVEDIYYDTQTREPEWIGLGAGLFGRKRLLAPVAGASARDGAVHVPYSKEMVKDSPEIDEDEISPDLESRLYSHYGVAHSTRRSDTVLPDERHDAPTGAAEHKPTGERRDEGGSVVRKEEELRVGTRPVEGGRVRLRKWVETEPATADVEVTRERAHIERERIDEPVSAHDFGEEEVELPLGSEEPVVQKETVAKERVSVGKTSERERRSVSDTLRKERVDVDRDGVEDVDEIE